MKPTLKRTSVVLLCLALLGGCASLRNVTSDVSSFGEWPDGRKAGTFAFERLPSQVARADEIGRAHV